MLLSSEARTLPKCEPLSSAQDGKLGLLQTVSTLPSGSLFCWVGKTCLSNFRMLSVSRLHIREGGQKKQIRIKKTHKDQQKNKKGSTKKQHPGFYSKTQYFWPPEQGSKRKKKKKKEKKKKRAPGRRRKERKNVAILAQVACRSAGPLGLSGACRRGPLTLWRVGSGG